MLLGSFKGKSGDVRVAGAVAVLKRVPYRRLISLPGRLRPSEPLSKRYLDLVDGGGPGADLVRGWIAVVAAEMLGIGLWATAFFPTGLVAASVVAITLCVPGLLSAVFDSPERDDYPWTD